MDAWNKPSFFKYAVLFPDLEMNDIYHERQSKELCALHALNNIFQARDAFSQVGIFLENCV